MSHTNYSRRLVPFDQHERQQRHADRALQRDSVAQLQAIIDRVQSGRLPRWVLVSIAAPIQVAARIVNGVNREHACAEACGNASLKAGQP